VHAHARMHDHMEEYLESQSKRARTLGTRVHVHTHTHTLALVHVYAGPYGGAPGVLTQRHTDDPGPPPPAQRGLLQDD